MTSLAGLLRQQPTVTLSQLQNKIFSKKSNQKHKANLQQHYHHPSDLKILSPFYKRIDQHPSNCKCVYHKRIRYQPKPIQRCKTQPEQDTKQKKQILINIVDQIVAIQEASVQAQNFDTWRHRLSSQQLKNFYQQYQNTATNFTKSKRHKELDCYNHAFQQFLKNNYLVILDKKKTQTDIPKSAKQVQKGLYRNLNKMKTQGNIDLDRGQFIRKASPSNKQNSDIHSQIFENGYGYTKDGSRLKKIVFKSTGKSFQLSDDDPNSKKEKRNNTKFYSSRPSFFGIIQDQEVIKQLCMRFMHNNKSLNREAELMLKQLVESDIDMYTKLMNDIEENLEDGLTIPHLAETQSNILVKIVLQKMNKEVQAVKTRDNRFTQKYSIIENLCSKYGWLKQEKPMGLQQFWKFSQSMKNCGMSRKSLGTQKDAGNRRKSPLNNNSADKNIKTRLKIGKRDSRMSGFFKDKGFNKLSNSYISSSNFNLGTQKIQNEKSQPNQSLGKITEQFRFNNNKQVTKKGVLVTRKKHKKLSSLNGSEGFSSFSRDRKGLVRKETCFFRTEQVDEKESTNNIEQNKSETVNEVHKEQFNDRNSSIYSTAKNIVLRHIQANKKFLKRIQHQLVDKQCDQLIIGIGANIITKKRKIRAIYNALRDENIQTSMHYNDMVKYLQIYEEYCDLVVKFRKQKKIKSEMSVGKFSESYLLQKNDESQQIHNLLDDLKKQRQLKYFNLKGLEEKEDPKQELILQIPQYTTQQPQKIPQKKKPQKLLQRDNTKQTQFIQIQKQYGSILQRKLEHIVNMHCQTNKSKATNELLDDKKQYSSPLSKNMTQFQIKLLRYRKMLKLQQVDDSIVS